MSFSAVIVMIVSIAALWGGMLAAIILAFVRSRPRMLLRFHPFDLLYQLGFSVTVNVDNRTMSRTSLTRELALLADAFEYDLDDLEVFQLNAAAGAFLPVEEREELTRLMHQQKPFKCVPG